MCPMHQSMQSRVARESSAQSSKLRIGRHICSVYMVQSGRSATPDFLPRTEQLSAATHCHQHHARVTFFVCYDDSATRTASKYMVPMATYLLFSQASRISCVVHDLPCGSTPCKQYVLICTKALALFAYEAQKMARTANEWQTSAALGSQCMQPGQLLGRDAHVHEHAYLGRESVWNPVRAAVEQAHHIHQSCALFLVARALFNVF